MKGEGIINQLDEVFKGRAKKPSECMVFETEKLFYIEDDSVEGKCISFKAILHSKEEEQKYLKIINENGNKVTLWATDGCFFSKGKPPKHCDCIFFDETDFCFVEFKLNATSLHPKTIKENREYAISQLKSMIEMIKKKFEESGFTFLGYSLQAYLCTPENYPNKNNSISDFAVEFLENYGVKLYEQNYKKLK